jgi:hypothetical protein
VAKYIGVTLWGVVILVVLVPTAFVAAKYYQYAVVRDRENEVYAELVFGGIVDFVRVLASKQWMAFTLDQLSPAYELGQMGGSGGELFCRFAVVNLAGSAGASPPEIDVKQSPLQMKSPFNFAGDWHPTPISSVELGGLGFRYPCAGEVGKALISRMTAALTSEGSWWRGSSDIFDGALYVYSKPQNLAVRLYYGD